MSPSPGCLAAGRRVVLRRFREDDATALLAYRCDPAVARYQSWEAMDRAEARRMARHMGGVSPLLRPGRWTQIALADPETDGLLGDMGLHLSEGGAAAEMGITLARAAQGRGLAEEAVRLAMQVIWRESAARVIWGIADVRNAASLALIARTGGIFDREETTGGVTERFFRYPRPPDPC